MEILAVVSGLKTLPAVAVAGKSAPTMHKVDFHVYFSVIKDLF